MYMPQLSQVAKRIRQDQTAKLFPHSQVEPQNCYEDNFYKYVDCVVEGTLGGSLCGALYEAGRSICGIL